MSEELKQLIKSTIREELKRNHTCHFNVTPQDAAEFGHLTGMVKDIGGGGFSKGIEAIRENHKWTISIRQSSSRIGSAAVYIFISALLTGVLLAVWQGFKHMVGK